MAKLCARSAIECRFSSILAHVIRIERNCPAPRPCGIKPPERSLMVGHVVEKAAFIQVRTHGPRVDVPGACLASDLDAVKALANSWPFSNRHKPARAVIQLLPADSQHDPVFLV